jgi:predicted RNA binding protein YcfA (HicA-like mRNA interferase family)
LPKKYPPLTPSEVLQILKARKFHFDSQRGDHQQWEGTIKGKKRKVTVDMGETDIDDKNH